MRFLTHAVIAAIAAVFLIFSPAHAVEIDCPPEITALQRSEGVTLDEELKEKRKKARELELARVKARFMQQVRSGSASAEPVPAVLVPAQ